MKELYYTFAVDDVKGCSQFYKRNLNWAVEEFNDYYYRIETDSPIIFYLVDKTYLLDKLEIEESELSTLSFVTWEYDSEDELLEEKENLLSRGMKELGTIGHFLSDPEDVIWELKVRGGVL